MRFPASNRYSSLMFFYNSSCYGQTNSTTSHLSMQILMRQCKRFEYLAYILIRYSYSCVFHFNVYSRLLSFNQKIAKMTVPPSGVNFRALDNKLKNTFSNASLSNVANIGISGRESCNAISLCRAVT